jgi:malate dehydrogenase (oxaloacetate-decarboxylating)
VAASVAKAAAREGLARTPLTDPVQQIHEAMWRPSYPQVQAI